MFYQTPVVLSGISLRSGKADVKIPGITGELYGLDYFSKGFFHNV
jgi:hypothetical protein